MPGGTVIHPLPDDVVKVDLKILSRSKKGIYGEIISDNWMANHKFENLLPEHRRVRSLNDKPRGRGIDGIYKNTNPPPPYVVTETKFRTAGGVYRRGWHQEHPVIVDDQGIGQADERPVDRQAIAR